MGSNLEVEILKMLPSDWTGFKISTSKRNNLVCLFDDLTISSAVSDYFLPLKSTALFGAENVKEHVIIKQEHLGYESNLDYNDVDDMQTDDLPSYPGYGENEYMNEIDPLFKSENVSIKEENSSIKGVLISEGFPPMSFPQKICRITILNLNWRIEDCDLVSLFEKMTKVKKLSKTK